MHRPESRAPQPPGGSACTLWRRPGFGHRARSLAATGAISVDFSSSGYLDVSVPRVVPRRPMCSGGGCRGIAPGGFPHSGTPGSKAVCASPGTIAACRALRRLPAPRHPPCALDIFDQEHTRTAHGAVQSKNSLLRSRRTDLSNRSVFHGTVITVRELQATSQMNCIRFAYQITCRGTSPCRAYAAVKVRLPGAGPGGRMLRIGILSRRSGFLSP